MPDYDLDDLLAKLNEVASSSDPDEDDDRDPNDDPDDGNFDPNDDPDNVDDPGDVDDDPRSYRDDDEEEDDFSKPSVFNRIMVLQRKLDVEARTLSTCGQSTPQAGRPESKAQLNLSKIAKLRSRTADIKHELSTNKLLEQEAKRYQEARVALYLNNLSPERKREHDEGVQRMAQHYSARYPDASPTWRDDAAEAFRNKHIS